MLLGILAAITWPAALLSVSNIIDNPWSVSMQRAVSAGKQLAEVLLAREQVRFFGTALCLFLHRYQTLCLETAP